MEEPFPLYSFSVQGIATQMNLELGATLPPRLRSITSSILLSFRASLSVSPFESTSKGPRLQRATISMPFNSTRKPLSFSLYITLCHAVVFSLDRLLSALHYTALECQTQQPPFSLIVQKSFFVSSTNTTVNLRSFHLCSPPSISIQNLK